MHRPGLAERWKVVALPAGGSAIFVWQLRNPIIRLEWPVVNELLGFILGLCLSWLTAAAIFRIGRWWSKTIALIAVLSLLLYSVAFLIGWANISFDQFAETRWKGSEVRFYRTDGGATTDFGFEIGQERSLIPGVVLVRSLDHFYPCRSRLDLTSTDEGIAITNGREACEGFREQRRDYRLKPFLYF